MAIPTTGEFDIVIKMPEETGKAQTPNPAQPQQENTPTTEDPARGDKASNAILAGVVTVAINAGKQALNAAVSNIGLATGNSYKQEQVQRTISGVTGMLALGGMLMTGNYLGAIATAASYAISFASENYQINKQREIENYAAAQYARKIGYTNGRK